MKTTLLAIAAAALLSGSATVYAQSGAPGDQNRDQQAQPTEQSHHPRAASPAQPGATGRDQMGPGGQSSAPDMDRDRNMQPTQLQGDRDRTQDQDRDRMQGQDRIQDQNRNGPQGGEMLRGGEERGEHHTLTIREKTNLRDTVLRGGPRLTHVNFRIGVGARVPRSVRLVTVPQPIVAIYPEWANDLYFDYGDEIVVVQPDTMQIVGVLPL
jgi:hypothetical protein